MLDLNFVRDHLEVVEEKLRQRGANPDELLRNFREIDTRRRAAITETESLKAQRNRASDEIAKLKKNKQDATGLIEETKNLRGQIEDDLALRGEHGLFTQAVSNLIENALKYTPPGGTVEVRARRRPDSRIEIDVLDDGPGVPPVDRDRVLERFVRLETARSTPGVGLGLSLVAAVARLHQGGLHLRDGLSDGERRGLGAALVLPALPAQPALAAQ